jgi:hypothetical protein
MKFPFKPGLVLIILLFAQVAKSQTDLKMMISDSLTGTWVGSFSQSIGQKENKRPILIFWRIHKIDEEKQQVEMTQMGQRLDGSDIKKPKSLTYKGFFKDSCLVLEFNKETSGMNLTLRLKKNKMDEMFLLQDMSTRDPGKGTITTVCILGKISDDVSKYKKPKNSERVEIAIASPPPVKN